MSGDELIKKATEILKNIKLLVDDPLEPGEELEPGNWRLCPKCNKKYDEYPALSRVDNKTDICPRCGIKEAVNGWMEHTVSSLSNYRETQEKIDKDIEKIEKNGE